MGLGFNAIDPLYAIDYSKMINSQTSSNSIKAFATSLNQMTNSNIIDFFDDDDSLFSLSPSNDIYSSLYKYNSVYSTSLSQSILNDKNNNFVNKYKTEFDKALLDLYNKKEMNNITDDIFSQMLNDNEKEVENIFMNLLDSLDENSEEYKKIISLKDSLNDYKIKNEKFSKEQNKIDKMNEENEKVEALFDLIDAINNMYQKYSENERKNYDKKKRKY